MGLWFEFQQNMRVKLNIFLEEGSISSLSYNGITKFLAFNE